MLSINEILDKIESIYFMKGCSLPEAIRLGTNDITEKDLRGMNINDLSNKEVI